MNESMITIRNGKVATYSSKPKGLPQLFCIHGGMGLGSDSVIPGLAPLASLFDLVFVDQRGCGKSDPAKDGSYLFSDFASDIVEVVQQTKAKGPVGIFGHSMGGMIAVETLARFPDLFQFAILSNTAIDTSWRSDGGNDLSAFKTEEMARAVERYSGQPEDKDRLRELAVAYGPLYFRELPENEGRRKMDEFSYRGDTLGFMNQNCYPGLDLKSEAASIHVPTLILSGGEDIITPSRCSNMIAEVIPGSTHAVIEGAGHFPFVTRPNEFFEQVSQWWEETRRKS